MTHQTALIRIRVMLIQLVQVALAYITFVISVEIVHCGHARFVYIIM